MNQLGAMIAFWLTALYRFVITLRNCIHLFSADRGAQSIATIDTSVAGGDNIIAVFGQWGLPSCSSPCSCGSCCATSACCRW
jgi:hypothetical protein